jgi:hypothetical protein
LHPLHHATPWLCLQYSTSVNKRMC